MEKSVSFKSICKKFEKLLENLHLSNNVKDFADARFYEVFSAPYFSDFFLGSELCHLVDFCRKYQIKKFCIIESSGKVCFSLVIPFDL